MQQVKCVPPHYAACSILKPEQSAKAKQLSGGGLVVCVEGVADVSGFAITSAYAMVLDASAAIPDEPPAGATSLSVTSTGFSAAEIGVPGSSGSYKIAVWVLWDTGSTSSGASVYLMQRCNKMFTIGTVGSVTDCDDEHAMPNPHGFSLEDQVRWLCRALCEKELEIQRLREQLCAWNK